MSVAELLRMQAPQGIPRSDFFAKTSDPLIPPSRTSEVLAHFFEPLYDLRPESSLSKLMKVLLGDAGTGQLRKRYTYSHLSHFLLTTHYNDLDQFYGQVLGLPRMVDERLEIDPYRDAVTEEEWERIDARDGAYRARIEAFSHSLLLAGTPTGMVIAASAILGEEVRVYETYPFVDDAEVYQTTVSSQANAWGDLEDRTYGDLERSGSYGALEATSVYHQRLSGSRGEFIIRPLRPVSAEEHLHLTRALNRIKPAEALLTVDTRPTVLHKPVPVRRAEASSTYWHVQSRVQVAEEHEHLYERATPGEPVEQPRFAFSAYQGEAWSYNGDVVSVESYVEDAEGNVVQGLNYDTQHEVTGITEYTPDLALADQTKLLLGRAVSDGILTTPPVVRETV